MALCMTQFQIEGGGLVKSITKLITTFQLVWPKATYILFCWLTSHKCRVTKIGSCQVVSAKYWPVTAYEGTGVLLSLRANPWKTNKLKLNLTHYLAIILTYSLWYAPVEQCFLHSCGLFWESSMPKTSLKNYL